MLRPRSLALLSAFAILAAACGPTPTPTPAPGPGQVEIISPQDGQVFQFYEAIPWSVEAASHNGVEYFSLTHCNSDEIAHASMYPDITGEAGPEGTLFHAEESSPNFTDQPGECTIKVQATDGDNNTGPWSQVTFSVADPPVTKAIQMEILSPQDGDSITVGTMYNMAFKAASPLYVSYFQFQHCLAPGQILQLDLSGIEDGGAEGTFYLADMDLPAEDVGPCTIKARAVSGDPSYQASGWQEINIQIKEAMVLVSPGVPPMLPTPTNTPGGSWQATAKMNANCRAGPSTAHNEWGYALDGDVVEVVGRNEDGTWLNVLNPHAAGKCWLSILALDVPFDVNGLPAVSYPTPAPTDEGGEPPAAQGCLVTTAAGGTVCMAPCPAGAAPGTACTP
jgi:hypothetical protein